jgi:predicted enzyme related to lactoylglutathione lyase
VALATYKDLCIDANDPARLAAFWGALLGLRDEPAGGDDRALRGAAPTDTIWFNRVPEPKTVKHRLHIDVDVPAREPLVELGATIVLPAEESGFRWSQMADPEGGELCAFVRDPDAYAAGRAGDGPPPPARLYELGLDTATSESSRQLASWWADVFGGKAADDGQGYWWVEDVAGAPFSAIVMAPVPEPKVVKNRLHWDVVSSDLPGLLARGATVLAEPTATTRWHVCADPEGNEFCVFAP